MDALSTAAVTAHAASTAATTAATDVSASGTTGTGTTAATTPATAKKSFTELFAAAEKDLESGEKLEKVSGHSFGRIDGGKRDQMCVNLSGNARNGEAFDLVTRNGHSYHVYGSGKDRVVVGMGAKAAAKSTTPAASTDATTASTTSAASGGTAAAATS